MSTQTVTLHGGPLHGKIVELEGHKHVLTVAAPPRMPEPTEVTPAAEIGIRTGRYSRVHGSEDFEWDGWQK